MDNPVFNRPIFIARVLHNEIKFVEGYPFFDGIIMDANLAIYNKNPYQKILKKRESSNCGIVLIDPNTAELEHQGYFIKKTFMRLPYLPQQALVPDDFLSGTDGLSYSKEFAESVLATQFNLGADVLLTPYFNAKSLRSPWHKVNMLLGQLCHDIRTEYSYDKPVWQVVCISAEAIGSETKVNQLVSELINLDTNGYFLLINGFSDRSSGTEELESVALLVNKLSKYRKPVIMGAVDAFGLFMCALGAQGFSAGICWMDSYDETNFLRDLGGRLEETMRERFIYMPEMFIKLPRDISRLSYLTVDSLKTYGPCQGRFCTDKSIPQDVRARLHFLEQRKKEMEELGSITQNERLQFLNVKLDTAISLAKDVANEDIRIKYSHLTRWKDALSNF